MVALPVVAQFEFEVQLVAEALLLIEVQLVVVARLLLAAAPAGSFAVDVALELSFAALIIQVDHLHCAAQSVLHGVD